jgi:16S rRNA C967 or C1407 C5-methylase (RsmB/RsmF family)
MEQVKWCEAGYYLKERPSFTFDPLFHAGCYYVQEASSMFLEQVMKLYVAPGKPIRMLDLCAAPGGKSTHARSLLPEGSLLVSNEVVRNRAQILAENLYKWGYSDTIITNNQPEDFKRLRGFFDVILVDAPCSGEGMFRKDPDAVSEWSAANVELCSKRQRRIVEDIWPALADNGLLVYSTCTYNIKENEENVSWMVSRFGAQPQVVGVPKEWCITGNLAGSDFPVYRFLPHKTKGEGFFMAVLRKPDEGEGVQTQNSALLKKYLRQVALPELLANPTECPMADLDYDRAIAYLRREAITLPPETPRGYVTVTYHNVPLGLVKNIGSRANNLYPQAWRIRSRI